MYLGGLQLSNAGTAGADANLASVAACINQVTQVPSRSVFSEDLATNGLRVCRRLDVVTAQTAGVDDSDATAVTLGSNADIV